MGRTAAAALRISLEQARAHWHRKQGLGDPAVRGCMYLVPRAQADSLATFLKDDVGHARSFSLDTMEAVQERANLVKKM